MQPDKKTESIFNMRTAVLMFFSVCLLYSNSFSQDYKQKLEEIHQNVHLIILIENGVEQNKKKLMIKFDVQSLPEKNRGHYDTIKMSLDPIKIEDIVSFNNALDKLDTLIKQKFSIPGDQNRMYALSVATKYINLNKEPVELNGTESDSSKTGGSNNNSALGGDYIFYFGIFVVLCFLVLFFLFYKIYSQVGNLNQQLGNLPRPSDPNSKGGGLRGNDVTELKRDLIRLSREELPSMSRGITDQLLRMDAKLEQFRNPSPNVVGNTNPIPSPNNIYYTDQLIDPKGWSKSSLSTSSGLYKLEFPKNSSTGTITLNQQQVTSAVLNNPFQSFPSALCEYKAENFVTFTKVYVTKQGTVADDGNFIRITGKIQLDLIK